MKKNKAPDPDKLNTKLLQQAIDEIKNALYDCMNCYVKYTFFFVYNP